MVSFFHTERGFPVSWLHFAVLSACDNACWKMPDLYGQRLTQTYVTIVKPKVSPCTSCICKKSLNNETCSDQS